jgi:hypothetical protein
VINGKEGIRVALRMGHLYDALLAAQVPEDQAQRAAEEMADHSEQRLGTMERDLALLKWMAGTNVLLTVAVLGRLLLIR